MLGINYSHKITNKNIVNTNLSIKYHIKPERVEKGTLKS